MGSNKIWTDDPRGPSTDIIPVAPSSVNLGSSQYPFKNVYADNLVVDTEVLDNNAYLKSVDAAGTGTLNLIKADATDNTFLNAKTGKVGKFGINNAAIGTWDANSIDFPAFNLSDGSDKNYALAVYAAGTAYSLTNTAAALDFGTTDPVLTINKAGTYLLMGRVNLKYTGATFAASRTVTLKIRRTNNTAADVSNTTITLATAIVTTVTAEFGVFTIPPVLYTTANLDDALTLFGDVSVVPSAGTLDADQASLIAIRLY